MANKILDDLIAAGVPSDTILAVAKLIADAEARDKIREQTRERVQRHRERKHDVTLRNVTKRYPPRAYTTPPEEVDSSLRSLSTPPVTQGAAEAAPPAPKKLPRGKIKTTIPEDFTLDEQNLAFAMARGWPAARAGPEFERFCDHARANNRKQADWRAAWRNWVTSPYQRSETMNGQPSKSVADVFAELSQRESADPCWVLPQIGRS